ncbi:MAG: Rieske (2Fe-2S) protein [Pirellula sp.]|jgi:nitrite reductase/ring-hydroxylating ferredoxin subunit
MTFQPVADSDSLVEGQGIEVIWQGNIIAVFRQGGSLYALDGTCMHQGGPLARGKLCQGTIQCPWHGWTYELATGNNTVTSQSMLKTYPVREQAGKIEIDLGD